MSATVILLYIIGVFLLVITLAAARSAIRLKRLRREREGKSFDRAHFIAAFAASDVPLEVPTVVFDYYTSKKGWRGFPFAPDDKYSAVLYDDPLDMEHDARDLLDRLKMILPPQYVLREWGNKRIETLRDMVVWLDWVRQHQSSSAKDGAISRGQVLSPPLS